MATRLVVGWGRIDLFSLLIPSCDTTIFHIGGLKNISGNATTSRYSIFFLVCTTFLRLELVALPPQQLGGGYFRQLHVGLLLHTFSMGLSLSVCPSIHHQQARNYFVPHLFTPRLMSHVTYIELVGLANPIAFVY